ncbi:MAG: Na+/H+ antiporter subunit E [Clostridia bacterium]|nr:Na+/H+ antiporter subunit E [Clostridia bacterium]
MYLVFFALWIVFNGRFTWEIAAFGAVVSAAVYLFSVKFLGYSPKKELKAVRMLPQIGRYLWLVVTEIVKSNVALINIVYGEADEIKPQLVTFKTPLKGAYKSILADCITVTPGTISVVSEDDRLTVHALDQSFAEGIEDTEFQKQLLQMQEGGKKC